MAKLSTRPKKVHLAIPKSKKMFDALLHQRALL